MSIEISNEPDETLTIISLNFFFSNRRKANDPKLDQGCLRREFSIVTSCHPGLCRGQRESPLVSSQVGVQQVTCGVFQKDIIVRMVGGSMLTMAIPAPRPDLSDAHTPGGSELHPQT